MRFSSPLPLLILAIFAAASPIRRPSNNCLTRELCLLIQQEGFDCSSHTGHCYMWALQVIDKLEVAAVNLRSHSKSGSEDTLGQARRKKKAAHALREHLDVGAGGYTVEERHDGCLPDHLCSLLASEGFPHCEGDAEHCSAWIPSVLGELADTAQALRAMKHAPGRTLQQAYRKEWVVQEVQSAQA